MGLCHAPWRGPRTGRGVLKYEEIKTNSSIRLVVQVQPIVLLIGINLAEVFYRAQSLRGTDL